jgi:nitrogen-specific signal transduction histidine kinase
LRTFGALGRARAEETLRSANRLKHDVPAMLAHEPRNLQAPIRAAADLLQIGKLDETGVRKTSRKKSGTEVPPTGQGRRTT